MRNVIPLAACALACLLIASDTFAQTGPMLLIRPMPKDRFVETLNTASVQNNGSTDNGFDFGLSIYESFGRVTEKPDRFLPRLGWSYSMLDLHTHDPVLPDQLTDMSVAAGFKLPEVQGFVGGLTLGIGYAGDTPFADGNGFYGKGTIVFGKKLNKTDDLALLLDYDGNRTFMPDVPLPGIVYRRQLDRHFLLALGAPVTSLEWSPRDDVKLEMIYTMLDRLDARFNYEFVRRWNVFALFEQRRDGYHLDELDAGDHNQDRLLFEQRRAELGLKWEASEDVSLTLAGGYAFGQEFNVGFDTRDMDELAEPSDEPYLRVGLEARF
jgi:hypothetical protein